MLVNPEPMARWGFIVVALLALGSVPLFVGRLFVLPVLGHANGCVMSAMSPMNEYVLSR